MTIQDIHIAFNQELDKTQKFEYPSFLPEQIDYWLNKAQLAVISEIAYPKDPRVRGFENGQDNIDELKDMVKPSGELTPIQEDTVYKITLPNDYFHLVRHRCKTIDTNCNNKIRTVSGKPNKLDFDYSQDPFYKPVAEEPLYYIMQDSIIYETLGNYKLQSTNLTYIKTPNKMQFGEAYIDPSVNVECEFKSEDMQHKIINKAVSMVLENIESVRYQTNLNELKEY